MFQRVGFVCLECGPDPDPAAAAAAELSQDPHESGLAHPGVRGGGGGGYICRLLYLLRKMNSPGIRCIC